MSETAVAPFDLVFRAGDTETRVITWTDDDSAAIDLTGYTVELSIGSRKNDPSATTYTSGQVSITDDAAGEVTITFTPAQTAALTRRKYYYELTVTSAGGQATTLLDGLLTVEPEVAS